MTPEEVTLRDYLEICLKGISDKLDAQGKYIEQHFILNELAITKAEESMLQRLESMNEFRAQIKDERGNMATKDGLANVSEALDKRLKNLENTNSFSAGKLWMVMAIFATVPTVLALIALFK